MMMDCSSLTLSTPFATLSLIMLPPPDAPLPQANVFSITCTVARKDFVGCLDIVHTQRYILSLKMSQYSKILIGNHRYLYFPITVSLYIFVNSYEPAYDSIPCWDHVVVFWKPSRLSWVYFYYYMSNDFLYYNVFMG